MGSDIEEQARCGIVDYFCTLKGKIKKKNWKHDNIFETKVMCNRDLCSMVIDGESCANINTGDAIKKLGIKVESHPYPHKLHGRRGI